MSDYAHSWYFLSICHQINEHKNFEEKQNSFNNEIKHQIWHDPRPHDCHEDDKEHIQSYENTKGGDWGWRNGNYEDKDKLSEVFDWIKG